MTMVNVFVSVAGQNDNLGDSVLRRGFLRAFRQPTVTATHVHVGANDDDYLSAVGLVGNEVLHRSVDSWSKALDASIARQRTVLGFNAGEVQVTASRAHLGWRTLARVQLARLRRGSGIHAGVGVRDPRQGSTAALRAVLRSCAVVSWRDEDSRAATGIGAVAPDWAFGEGGSSEPTASRDRIVVSMRGDRPFPTSGWLDAVGALANHRGDGVTVFSQVRRDNDRARELAQALGSPAELVIWESGTHADWEARARSLYSRTSVVVSDRLHALVIGATEGAVPIGMTVGDSEKLRRTLGAAELGSFAFGFDSRDDDGGSPLTELSRRGEQVGLAVARARTRLGALELSIADRFV